VREAAFVRMTAQLAVAAFCSVRTISPLPLRARFPWLTAPHEMFDVLSMTIGPPMKS
jgi:hypothetical protein